DRNTRYESWERQPAYAPRLLDNVLAREIVAALLEHLLQDLSLLRTEHVVGITDVGTRQIFREMIAVPLDAAIIDPLLVARVLEDCRGDDAHSFLRPRGDDS